MPVDVRREIRAALIVAQSGETSIAARRMQGRLRDAMEIIAYGRDATFRGIYYVGKELIYALHFFQKKSKHGVKTPKRELDLIQSRLASARRDENRKPRR